MRTTHERNWEKKQGKYNHKLVDYAMVLPIFVLNSILGSSFFTTAALQQNETKVTFTFSFYDKYLPTCYWHLLFGVKRMLF